MWCFSFKTLSHRNDLLLPGICVQRADTELFHHHSENPEEGDRYQECEPALRDVPRPAWVPPATQQPSTGVHQICLPGILPPSFVLHVVIFFTPRCAQISSSIISIPSFVHSGPFTGCQHSEPGEQAEKRPPAPRGRRRVFGGSPVP